MCCFHETETSTGYIGRPYITKGEPRVKCHIGNRLYIVFQRTLLIVIGGGVCMEGSDCKWREEGAFALEVLTGNGVRLHGRF